MAKLVTGRHEIVATERAPGTASPAARPSATYSSSRRGYGPAQAGRAGAAGARHLSLALHRRPRRLRLAARSSTSASSWSTGSRRGALAACIVEPILSSGGVLEPPEGYMAALAEKCRERGMLLIFDEAQTGLGRTGHLFACERDGVVPEFLTLSKTLGAGLPLAAMLTTPEIEDVATSAASCSTPRTPPIRCRRRSASRCSRSSCATG